MTDFTTITACGECCVGCSKKKDGSCPGCIESDGRVPEWAESGMCKVHACCKEHNARFCGVCSEFPCDKLPQMISWNPEIIKHLSALRDEYICSSLSGKITELCNAMSGIGIKEVRLGWVKGNPQAEHFRKKNGFAETGATNETDKYKIAGG